MSEAIITKVKFNMGNLTDLFDLAYGGLCTDGGHHKQYYLEQILKIIINDEKEFKKLKEFQEWEEGIPG